MALHHDDACWMYASSSPDVQLTPEQLAENAARQAAHDAEYAARQQQIVVDYTGCYVVVVALLDDDGATYYRAVSGPDPDRAMKVALSWVRDGGHIFADVVTSEPHF